jgi:hypothetical protein
MPVAKEHAYASRWRYTRGGSDTDPADLRNRNVDSRSSHSGCCSFCVNADLNLTHLSVRSPE